LAPWSLVEPVFNVSSRTNSRNFTITDWFYWYSECYSPSDSAFSGGYTISTPFFLTWLIREICDEQIPARQGRSNPRVVKKPRSKFPSKKPCHRGIENQHQHLKFSIVSTA
jgi:hypothetical protein